MLNLAPSSQVSGFTNGLSDGLVNPATDAELAVKLLEEVTAMAVVEARTRAHDVDSTRVTGLLGREGDGGRGSLDAGSLLVL